ncbi:MAG: hypothetical protein P8X90_08625 [Desulfobacterales bacterium]|jgi:transcriptional regulator with PAS, ATPase and Fis domain
MNLQTSGKQQDEIFKTVLDNVSDGVTVIDKNLKIRYQNKTIVQLFGSKLGEFCYAAYRSRQEPCGDSMVLDVLKDGRERRGIRDKNTAKITKAVQILTNLRKICLLGFLPLRRVNASPR